MENGKHSICGSKCALNIDTVKNVESNSPVWHSTTLIASSSPLGFVLFCFVFVFFLFSFFKLNFQVLGQMSQGQYIK